MSEELIDIHEEESELFEHYRIIVDKGQSLLRIDKFLMSRIQNATRTKIQAAIKAGNVLVNEQPIKSNYLVKPSDLITVLLPEPPRELELIAENIPLNIVYEDEYLVVVNKAAGMVVHPGYGNYSGTLVNAMLWHLQHLPARAGGEFRPGLVHRIDKNTSGLLLLAKDDFSLSWLARQFFEHSIKRSYYALVWGEPAEEQGTITGHIGRSRSDRKVMAVYPDGSQGKEAITHYKVIERFGYVSLVECRLETGRTHQIRAHFQHIGNPLFNDEAYGGTRIVKGTPFTKYKQFIQNCFQLIPRQTLHAKSLGFIHPHSRKELNFDSSLPDDFTAVLEKWRHYVAYSKNFEE